MFYNEIGSNEYVEIRPLSSTETYNAFLIRLKALIDFSKVNFRRTIIVIDGLYYRFAQTTVNAIVFFAFFYGSNTLYSRRLSIATTNDSGLNTMIQVAMPHNQVNAVTNLALSPVGSTDVTLRLYY